MKIFIIGLNKTGTTSIHHYIKKLGIPSIHYMKGKLLGALLSDKDDPLHSLKEIQCFSDFVDINNSAQFDSSFTIVERVKREYSDAKFILNTRNVQKWLKKQV